MSNPLEAQPSSKQSPEGQPPVFHQSDAPVTPGTINMNAGDIFFDIQQMRPLSKDFSEKSLEVAKKIDTNYDGFLQPMEIDTALAGSQLMQSEKDILSKVKTHGDQLREFSNDEWFGESIVSTSDLQKFGEVEKAFKAAPDAEKPKDSLSQSYRQISSDLLQTDLETARQTLRTFMDSNPKGLAKDWIDSSIDVRDFDPATKELAKNVSNAVLNGDFEKFQTSLAEWKKDPTALRNAVEALNDVCSKQNYGVRFEQSGEDLVMHLEPAGRYFQEKPGDMRGLFGGHSVVFKADGSMTVQENEQAQYPGRLHTKDPAEVFQAISSTLAYNGSRPFEGGYESFVSRMDSRWGMRNPQRSW